MMFTISNIPRRYPTWVWRRALITIPVSLSCRVAARRSVSPCRPPTSTSSRSGSDTSRTSWTLRATSCRVRKHTFTHILVTVSLLSKVPLFLTSNAFAALQFPIKYQEEKGGAGSSSSLTRNRSSSGNRPNLTSHSRPSSAVGLGEKETERGRTQMKVSTSNGGSTCFDSRVSSCKQPGHTWWRASRFLCIFGIFHKLCWVIVIIVIVHSFSASFSGLHFGDSSLQQTAGKLEHKEHFSPSCCLFPVP